MGDVEDDVWDSLTDQQRILLLRTEQKALRKEIEAYKKWFTHAAMGAIGVLLFQVLPYLQVIAKGIGK